MLIFQFGDLKLVSNSELIDTKNMYDFMVLNILKRDRRALINEVTIDEFKFNWTNPTGHWRLNLENRSQLYVMLKLIAINKLESDYSRDESGRGDTSQEGNWFNFRNAKVVSHKSSKDITIDQDFVDQPLSLQSWPSEAKNWRDENLERDFQELLAFRDLVNEKLEDLRKRGDIGRSLDAYLTISGSSKVQTFKVLRTYEKFLDELFIISLVELKESDFPDLLINVAKAEGGRCPRCWRWFPELKNGVDNEKLCSRCAEAII